ncbi:MAG: endonuclease/exonuclease/phosphatase family protein [Clostridia bacterium]|nr:endonuclease/exonuclease/phosphatase family protein [Clostridia bacterium]
MRIASYNIKCFNYNADKEKILEVLRTVNADVVGIQEADVDSKRSGPGNQIQMAAEALGYPYWYFAKAITHRSGTGAYGHGILSRYPILSAETVDYAVVGENDHDGNRCYARLLLDVGGKELAFYNTHLTLDRAGRAAELEQVMASMKQDARAVLTGDMNALPEEICSHVDPALFAMLNPGIPTFPQGENSVKAIDHIIVGCSLKRSESITVHSADCSDHNLIYAEIEV